MYDELTDTDLAVMDRQMLNVCPFGPLTRDEYDSVVAYEQYQMESVAEYERLEAMPRCQGRPAVAENSECDSCGKVKDVVYGQTACTLGYPGHPGAEFTEFRICGDCLTDH